MLSGLKNVALSDGEIRSVRGWLTWGSAYPSADPKWMSRGGGKIRSRGDICSCESTLPGWKKAGGSRSCRPDEGKEPSALAPLALAGLSSAASGGGGIVSASEPALTCELCADVGC